MTETPTQTQLPIVMEKVSLTIHPEADLDWLEQYGRSVCWYQRGVNFWIGDLAIEAEKRLGANWMQVFPEWMSPGHIARCKAVSEAFPPSSRNDLATWSQHRNVANREPLSRRVSLVAEMVDRGETSDESRERLRKSLETEHVTQEEQLRRTARSFAPSPPFLLAVDVPGFVYAWYHTVGNDAPEKLTDWFLSVVEKLKTEGQRGKDCHYFLTNAAFCFEGKGNFRKDLRPEYKSDRSRKPEDIAKRKAVIPLIERSRKLLTLANLCCWSEDGFEADDCIASLAKQFDGMVAILSRDGDHRQLLSGNCSMLWFEKMDDGFSKWNERRWITANRHKEEGFRYKGSDLIKGLTPAQFTDFQCLAGDRTDCIDGAVGIGPVKAAKLLKRFDSLDRIIDAATIHHEEIPESQRQAILALDRDGVEQLVTLRTDLDVPLHSTRLT